MACPECGDSAVDVGRCEQCGYEFVFGPDDDITDDRFLALVREASADDTLYFLRNHLYTAHARRFETAARATTVGPLELAIAAIPTVLAAAVAAGIARSAGPWAWAALAPGVALSAIFLRSMRRSGTYQPPNPTFVYDWITKWEGERGELPRLIRRRSLDRNAQAYPVAALREAGIERVVVTQHPLLVDLLVRNGFAEEHRALVVAENGYPDRAMEVVRELLQGDPSLVVFLIHDATDVGMAMPQRCSRMDGLELDGRPVVDVGLTPTQVSHLRELSGLGLSAKAYALPIDMLPYPLLEQGLARAMRNAASSTPGPISAPDSFLDPERN